MNGCVEFIDLPDIDWQRRSELTEITSLQSCLVTEVADLDGVVVDAIMGFDEARLPVALTKVGFVR